MGCIEDEYNIENISFSDSDLLRSKESDMLKSSSNKKSYKRKKKLKNKNKKVTFAPDVIFSKKESERQEENESEESDIEENNDTNNQNEEYEESKNSQSTSNNKNSSSIKSSEKTDSNKNSSSTESKNSSSNIKSSSDVTESKESSKNSQSTSNKNSNSIKSSEKTGSKENTEESQSSKDNNTNNNDSSKSSNKKESKENNKDSNNKISAKDKDKEKIQKKENNNHIITDDNWLESYINVTNEYKRKNINSSISPNDPILSELIDSKGKELILTSEDLVAYKSGNPSKKYKVLDLLESNSTIKMYKAVNMLTKNLVAIKKTKKYLNKTEEYGEPTYINVKNQIEIQKKLSHPNIVKIYEVYDIREYYFIIDEYCKYGNLYDYFRFHFSEKQICIIIYQILSGVLYLHENEIMHRDIRLDNIMVDHIEKDLSTSEPYFFIKIINFGSAIPFNKSKNETHLIGTQYYIAPEVIEENYNEKCDIWSVGVILYMLIAKKPPFDGKDKEIIYDKILEEDYNKNSRKLLDFSDEVRDLIDKLLEKDKDKRPSAKEALSHPWFQKYNGRGAFANFKFEDFNLIIEKLFNYQKLNKMQEIVLEFLVHNSPSNEENIKIMKIFRFFNTSGNCKLTKEELKKGLYKYKIKSEVNNMVDDLFKKLEIKEDKNYIEYEKFLALCVDKNSLFTKENLKNVYNYINYDKGEGITAKKIMETFKIKQEDIAEVLFNDLIIPNDQNSDLVITFGEFERIIRS